MKSNRYDIILYGIIYYSLYSIAFIHIYNLYIFITSYIQYIHTTWFIKHMHLYIYVLSQSRRPAWCRHVHNKSLPGWAGVEEE